MRCHHSVSVFGRLNNKPPLDTSGPLTPVIILKSHEFDAQLTTMCRRRLILTSTRDEEEVYESTLKVVGPSQILLVLAPSSTRI